MENHEYKTTTNKKGKISFHQDNVIIHELGFDLLLHPPYLSDLAPSHY